MITTMCAFCQYHLLGLTKKSAGAAQGAEIGSSDWLRNNFIQPFNGLI